MAITSVKVHPAIGVARVGNSPEEFFVGPERLWERPDPPGGFKDANCRVKRQAARFRVFAHHDDGSIRELTAAEAAITWTVHLANKKAVRRNPDGSSPADLTIDPGSRTLDGPDQRQQFDNGQIRLPGASTAAMVPLGEARTDDEGRLLVLGGFGTSASPTGKSVGGLENAGWYDDVSDGPVTATVRLHGSGEELEAAGAWVLVGPPMFAPQLENVITLYDAVFQMGVDQGWLTRPDRPSYTDDIYPILQRARRMRWVINVPPWPHTWDDPVYDEVLRQNIFLRLSNPAGGGGDMPRLASATLTQTQYAAMQAWKDNHFKRDWTAPVPHPQVSPKGLDRAALTACVGASFNPGIEAGGWAPDLPPIVDPAKYVGRDDPMRLDHSKVGPGDMSEFMALPWQADYKACGTGWWPVPRPTEVVPQASDTPRYKAWDRDVPDYEEMVHEWHTLGFVLRQGDQYVEVDRCDTTFTTLLTQHLDFRDVPQGPMGMSQTTSLAIEFEVRSTGAAVTLEVMPGDGPHHPRLKLEPTAATVGPTVGNEIATARLWVIYETGQVDEHLDDQVTVRQVAGGRAWTVPITANTVPPKAAAAALVLDSSASMLEDRGDGQSKHQSLTQAAATFVDLLLEGDSVGLVRSGEEAPQALTAVGPPGDPLDPARRAAKELLGVEPAPSAAISVGEGIDQGRRLLGAAGGDDAKALVVLTDGTQSRPRRRPEIAAGVNERTFTVALGTPQGTGMRELQAIAENSGGYLLATGPVSGDNRFVAQKYLLQILAGVSGAEVVLDADGVLVAGGQQQIPFLLTEADAGIDVILLTDGPDEVDFRLQTPIGFVLEPWRAVAEPSMAWVLSQGVSYYRVALPAELQPLRYERAGNWRALLSVGRPRDARPSDQGASAQDAAGPAAAGEPHRRLAYSILVHTYSNLSLRASVVQSSFEPGATVTVDATIAEAGMPAGEGASVWAEVARPDGPGSRVVLAEIEPGRFTGTFPTSVAGVYSCRVRASGRSRAGYPFRRDQTLTVAVWRGGDRDTAGTGEDDG